jgi:hypothetical protein
MAPYAIPYKFSEIASSTPYPFGKKAKITFGAVAKKLAVTPCIKNLSHAATAGKP